MIIFRQSTASQEFVIGKMVDSTDGSTAETGLTIANTDIKFFYPGGTTSTNKTSGGATHIAAGQYSAVADATDTATVGQGKIVVDVAGALVWERDYVCYPAAVYDWMFGVTANLPVNVTQFGGTNGTFSAGRPEVNTTHAAGTAWNSSAITAATLADDVSTEIRDKITQRTTLRGTVTTGSSTTSITTSAMSPATSVADQLKGRIVIFDHDTTTAALRGQATDITASSASATPTLTVTALTTAPSSGDLFTIV